MTLLGVDTESGGVDLHYSLLTVNFSLIDSSNFQVIDKLNLKLKPNPINGRVEFLVQGEALRVNNINLATHELESITYKESRSIIFRWLQNNHMLFGKLMPFGNGVSRDIELITNNTISLESWNNFCYKNPIELISIGNFLKFLGKIPLDQKLSLSSMAEYFGHKLEEDKVHTADYDVELSSFVIKGYRDMLS